MQTGNPYTNGTSKSGDEPNWQLQATVVALSTGPNGPSDGLGFTNATLVMSTVRGDGLTLQPDRPATVMDAALLRVLLGGANASAPLVSSTWTAFGDAGTLRWHHVLAVALDEPFVFAAADLGPAASAALAVYDWFSPRKGPLAVLVSGASNSSFSIPTGTAQPSAPAAALALQHLCVVPELPGGFWLFGEAGKIVPVSKQRIAGITLRGDGFEAAVLGSSGEPEGVEFLVALPGGGGSLSSVLCPSSAGQTATLSCALASGCGCTCPGC